MKKMTDFSSKVNGAMSVADGGFPRVAVFSN